MERQGIYMNPAPSQVNEREVPSACVASCHSLTGQDGGGKTWPPSWLHCFQSFSFFFITIAYLGMMRSGESRMARQPSAQNAYAPCASASGCAEMPPSKVWPVDEEWLATAVPRRLRVWCVLSGGRGGGVKGLDRDLSGTYTSVRSLRAL